MPRLLLRLPLMPIVLYHLVSRRQWLSLIGGCWLWGLCRGELLYRRLGCFGAVLGWEGWRDWVCYWEGRGFVVVEDVAGVDIAFEDVRLVIVFVEEILEVVLRGWFICLIYFE